MNKNTDVEMELGPDGKEWAKTAAGYVHVESVKHKAHQGSSPVGGLVWHGHAVREAFVAGAEWQEQRSQPAALSRCSVQPLEWREDGSARSPLGDLYSTKSLSANVHLCLKNGTEFQRWVSSEEQFRQAAQADYEQRILSALSAPAQRVEEGWRPVMQELVDTMRRYEVDVEADAPQKHRDMMDRADRLLAASPAPAPHAGVDAEAVERLRTAAYNIWPYLRWTISDESPGHHPTMPSAIGAFAAAFDLSEKDQINRTRAALGDRT